jgi:hypothetical protein
LKVNNGHTDEDDDSPIKKVARRSVGSRKRILSSSSEDEDDVPMKAPEKQDGTNDVIRLKSHLRIRFWSAFSGSLPP